MKLTPLAWLQGSKVPLRRDSARLSRADSLSDKEDMDVDEAVLQASPVNLIRGMGTPTCTPAEPASQQISKSLWLKAPTSAPLATASQPGRYHPLSLCGLLPGSLSVQR